MTGRDAARDELIEFVAGQVNMTERDVEIFAEALLSRGYRRSVTPDEIEDAAMAIYGEFVTIDPPEFAADAARAVARAFGLEVTE